MTVFGNAEKASLAHPRQWFTLLMVVPMTVILLNRLQIFSRVCRPNSAAQNNVLYDQFVSQFDGYVGAQLDLSVSLDDVAGSIGKLKKAKHQVMMVLWLSICYIVTLLSFMCY